MHLNLFLCCNLLSFCFVVTDDYADETVWFTSIPLLLLFSSNEYTSCDCAVSMYAYGIVGYTLDSNVLLVNNDIRFIGFFFIDISS